MGSVTLSLLELAKELSHGSRITSVANRHPDSYHSSDLAVRRAARLSVTRMAPEMAPEETQPEDSLRNIKCETRESASHSRHAD